METLFKGLTTQCLAKCSHDKTGQVWSVFLKPGNLIEAARRLYGAKYFIEDVTAMDTNDGFVVTYHFDHCECPGRVTLRVIIPRDKPQVPSISKIFQGADWHERETYDFYGIEFTGHPNLIPILLPDDAGISPLLREDNKRKNISNVLKLGEVVSCDPAIEALFAAEEEAEEEAQA